MKRFFILLGVSAFLAGCHSTHNSSTGGTSNSEVYGSGSYTGNSSNNIPPGMYIESGPGQVQLAPSTPSSPN